MARRKQRGKTINPTYYVFCEGKTEVEYINFLKREFRIPIEIKPKIEKNKISQRKVNAFLKGRPRSPKDKIFLMYDLDVEGILEKLNEITDATLLTSNPCIELWFLLHFTEINGNISSSKCLNELKKIWSDFEKGELKDSHKNQLGSNLDSAIENAERLKGYQNPSSKVYMLIEALKEAKRNKR